MKKVSNKFLYFFLFNCCLFCFPKSTNTAKNGDSHNNDYLMVLGLATYREAGTAFMVKKIPPENYDKLIAANPQSGNHTLFSEYAAIIDDGDKFNIKALLSDFNFSLGKEGHRVLFHWGYEYISREREDFFIQKLQDPSQKARFLRIIREAQKKQQKGLETAIQKYLGITNTNAKQSLGAVLYYTHMLGDYIDHSEFTAATVNAVVRLDFIIEEIIKYSKMIVVNEKAQKKYMEMTTALKVQINNAKSTSLLELTKTANEVLKILILHYPQLINENKIVMKGFADKKLKFVR